MSPLYSILQVIVVGGAVAASLWFTLGKYAPALRTRMTAAFTGKSPILQTQARGCASGCDSEGSCSGCGSSTTATTANEQPVVFHSTTALRDSQRTPR